MKIAIRADGGKKIGMGHIMRTLVLAKELAKTNDIFYVCKLDDTFSDKYKSGINKVKDEGFDVITINENNVLAELKNISADCLITDSYDVDEEYFNKTKKLFKLTGYIDDMNLYYFNVDFVINQNIGAEEYGYKVNKDTKLFLGSQYTMLREEFRKATRKTINKEVSDIMITLGGSDINGITNMMLDYIKDFEFNFHIIVGPSFEEDNIHNLKELERLKSNINLYFNANMVKVMNKCDIAISACGSTLYELAVCGVPTLGIIMADNQEKVAYKMDEKGLIWNIGWYKYLTKKSIEENLHKMCHLKTRLKIIDNQSIVNKNGVEKLSLEINGIKD